MNYTQQIMIKILSSAIHKKKFEISKCYDIYKIDFDEMLRLSQEHNVTALLYYLILNLLFSSYFNPPYIFAI